MTNSLENKDNIQKETREYFIPKPLRKSSLYGTEFEIRLRNQLMQKVIAKECAEWIREKVKFKSFSPFNPFSLNCCFG